MKFTGASLAFALTFCAGSALADDDVYVLQYGVGVAAEVVALAPAQCPAGRPCILGNGAGLALRGGVRLNPVLYLGGAYEMSRQDTDEVLRLATLQQLRAEVRRFIEPQSRLHPYFVGQLGVAAYGEQWSLDALGGLASVGIGVEWEIDQDRRVFVSSLYRAMYLGPMRSAGVQTTSAGVAHMFGLEFGLELNERR